MKCTHCMCYYSCLLRLLNRLAQLTFFCLSGDTGFRHPRKNVFGAFTFFSQICLFGISTVDSETFYHGLIISVFTEFYFGINVPSSLVSRRRREEIYNNYNWTVRPWLFCYFKVQIKNNNKKSKIKQALYTVSLLLCVAGCHFKSIFTTNGLQILYICFPVTICAEIHCFWK